MDTLTKDQQECYEKIVKIKTNYKKDTESRKTTTYVQNRLERLEFLWGTFIKRDKEIESIRETAPQHPYFAKNYFQEVESYYENLKDMFHAKLGELEPSETRTSTNEDNYSIKILRVQEETIHLLERLLQSVEIEIKTPQSPFFYQEKLNAIQTYWSKIMSNHTDIIAASSDIHHEYLAKNTYQHLEDSYHRVVVRIQEQLGLNQRSEEEVKLPRLVLPTFEGDYQQWTSFHDIFLQLIHTNTRLGDAEKMQYLKTHLRKEASSLVQHLTVSNINYKTAWQLLNDRYNNKRKICSTHIQNLLSQPKLDQESEVGIRKIHDTTRECLYALTNLGIDTDSWAPLIVHLIIQKLDHESHKLYEQTLERPRDLPTIETLFQFLESRFQSLESLKDSKRKEVQNQKTSKIPMQYKTYLTTSYPSVKCNFCQQLHKTYECPKFLRISVQERRQFIVTNKLCFNCLMHTASEKCRSRYKCNVCKRQHHTLLHYTKEPKTGSTTPPTGRNPKSTEQKVQSFQSSSNCHVILATALVKIRTPEGTFELLRALIDPGSQATFISEESANLLALPRFSARAQVSGLGLANAGRVKHKLVFELQPRFPSKFALTVEALVLPHLTKQLPNHLVTKSCNMQIYKNIVLADPTFHTPGPVNIIIGADIFNQILCKDIKKFSNGLLGQQTELGWILSGPLRYSKKEESQITSMISHVDLDERLRKFWEIEDLEPNPRLESDEDRFCEQHFMSTHRRSSKGSYAVRIPFNEKLTNLGESRRRALARLLQNEKKFSVNKKLEAEYRAFMQEYITLKHMVPCKQPNEVGLYLPHQAVLKEDSTTTKLRVVFDASSKTSTGLSLNGAMYAGPKLQNDLTNILIRWRKYRYVFTADIEKMYRQIKLHPDDQKYLKILWRAATDEPIQEYQMTTVTYGTASAPFLAIRTLHQLARDEKAKYPQASRVLLTDFYVDDMLSGTDSLREAKSLQNELISLLASGGFKLRKWTTNQQMLLQNIPEDYREKGSLEINNEQTIKTLGLYWLPASDCFQFQVKNITDNLTPTKRCVLSDIAKIYDPIGWLSPIVIKAKILMQEIWMAKLDWDIPLPDHLAQEWSLFKVELRDIPKIKIPRWIRVGNCTQSFEYHGYCDASEKAYAAVIYTRICTTQGDYCITMLTAKTKVAPTKRQISLPRLELCAAALLTKLLYRTKEALNINGAKEYLWTDSTITLSWIKNQPKKMDRFVSNRVSQILQTTTSETWHHVRSEDNPADCASRGISPLKLRNHTLWWSGPRWLGLPKTEWPEEVQNQSKPEVQLVSDNNASEISTFLSIPTTINSCNIFIRFSCLTRLIRVLTYCRRFLSRERSLGALKHPELHKTLTHCLRLVQRETFPIEAKLLAEGKPIPSSSKLTTLTPFLDDDGLLRLGGRLDHSHLSHNEKHPIILPHSSHFTTLVIKEAHDKTLHGGNQLTLTYLRRKYWIIDAKSAVRAVIHGCVTCCRHKGVSSHQLMGHLPAQRVIPSKPFTNTGIDYAGPFNLRMSKGRGTKTYKGYIALFVCLSTKAIHLEAVSDLTKEAFLAAFKRFISRRGLCANIYCDNATTFVGAKNELEKQFKQAVDNSHKDAIPYLTNCGTHWHFIPPAAPHFGGLWEAGVKSTKYHLKRVAGMVNWTFEEFTTLLTQVEACLNSRPLCPLNNDPEDLTVLTPGHFLIGEPIIFPPELVQPDKVTHLPTRWALIQKLRNDFWRIWSSEYLSRLQQRNKWQGIHQNLKVGDLILIKEDHVPPARWALGLIENTHPGEDGFVRVVTIKTPTTTIKRPITKICKLPFDTNEIPTPRPPDPNNSTCSNVAANATMTTYNNLSSSSHDKIPGDIVEPCFISTRKTPIEITTTRSTSAQKHPKIYPTNIPVRPSLDELKRQQNKSMRRSPNKRIKISNVFTSLLVLSMVLTVFPGSAQASNNSVEITQFKHNPGIYMEHVSDLHMVTNVWNVIVFYDLRTYYLQLYGFEQCLSKLSDMCNKTITYNYYCKSMLLELTHKVKQMHENNMILHKRNGNHLIKERKERKAPLEIIGTLQHALFGVLDQTYADHIEGEINKIKENENYLLSLAKNQTSVAEVTANVLKKTTAEIEHQFEVFNNHIATNLHILKTGIETNQQMQALTALVTYINLIMSSYETVQKDLIDLVLDAHNGKISPFLLTPKQLRDQINFIREHVKTTLIIPGETNSDELINLYKTMTVRSRMTNNRIIFQVNIPLPNSELFQLFKTYPIPFNHNEKFFYIEPSTEYLASNLHRDLYYPLTRAELSECIRTETLGYLCQQKQPLYTGQATLSRCEMDLLNHRTPLPSVCHIKRTHVSQYWIQLQHPNHWIFVVDKEVTINIVCTNQVIIKTLKNSGIIKLNQHCQVKHPTMNINARTTFSNTKRSSFLPLTNLSDLLAERKPEIKIEDSKVPLIHLDTKPLDNLGLDTVRDGFSTSDYHHVHHYLTTYIIIAVIVIAIVLYKYPPPWEKCSRHETTNDAFQVHPITPIPTKRTNPQSINPPPV